MIPSLLESAKKISSRQDEDEDTRQLTKSQLYRQLADTYFLPAIDSKGVTRKYLLGVIKHRFYRVDYMILKKFESEIKPSLMKRVSFVSLHDLVIRLNKYLEETGQPGLGFPAGIVPEEEWILRLTRYIDPGNIFGVFAGKVEKSSLLLCASSEMFLAQQKASVFLFGEPPGLLKNTTVLAAVKKVAVLFQKLTILNKEIEETDRQWKLLENKKTTYEAELNSAILKSSTTVLSCGEGLDDPDSIYAEDNQGEKLRAKLGQVNKMYALVNSQNSILLLCGPDQR